MRSFFQMSFHNGFRTDTARGFRPASGTAVLGQTDDEILNEELNQETPWSPGEGFQGSYYPSTTTTPATAAPIKRPPGTTDTDWAKILAEGLKAASQGYGIYTQAQIAQMKAEADLLKAKNPSVASLLPGDSKTTTIALVVGGIAVLGLLLVATIK